MMSQINRREFLVAAGGVTLLGVATHASLVSGQSTIPEPEPVPVAVVQESSPVAELPEPTDDGIDLPVLGIAFGEREIVATPEVPAGVVRLLTAVPYDDLGSTIFRLPDDQPDAIDQIWAAIMEPEPVAPDWFYTTYFPGGVRADFRRGGTAEGFLTLQPGTYAVMDFATGQSTTFVARDDTVGAIGPKDVPFVGASFAFRDSVSPESLVTVAVTALDSMTYEGLGTGLPAGRQLWALTNGGDMTHNIYVFGTTEGATPDDILDGIMNDDGSGSDGSTVGILSTHALSPGAVQYFYLDLEAGPHAAMCTETSDWQSPPHFVMGMIITFAVDR